MYKISGAKLFFQNNDYLRAELKNKDYESKNICMQYAARELLHHL